MLSLQIAQCRTISQANLDTTGPRSESASRLALFRIGRCGAPRRGFTVIELVVTVGVLGLLIALILPALQSGRAASRRTQCTSNLRNLGVALQGYESAKGSLPRGLRWRYDLLPFLDRQAVFDAGLAPTGLSLAEQAEHVSKAVGSVVITEYLCPADAAEVLQRVGNGDAAPSVATANYAACEGSFPLVSGSDGAFGSRAGEEARPLRISDISDGLSNTAAASEMLRSNGELSRLRSVWIPPASFTKDDADGLIRLCDSIPPDAADFGWFANSWKKGIPWYSGDRGVGVYNHGLGPNRPSCNNGTKVATGVFTATSLHSGGVNVLFVDGRVEFVNEGIDLQVWRGFASRSRFSAL